MVLAPPLTFLDDPRDVAAAVGRLVAGGVVAHGFANFYALTSRADADVVRAVNLLKGRPPDQVGSMVTTPVRLLTAFDLSRLPPGLDREAVAAAVDALLAAGPVGVRGPAAGWVPRQLVQRDRDVTTTQVISPGYGCPSNTFLAAATAAVGSSALYVTSANRSHRWSGTAEEPAHHRADALLDDFVDEPRMVLLRHRDEAVARERYPRHEPMSTSIVSFHRTGGPQGGHRSSLVLDRHGSLHVDDVRALLASVGLGLVLADGALRRLARRRYPSSTTPTPPVPRPAAHPA